MTKIKFGPAGLGPIKTSLDFLEQIHRQGLKACEIAFTYSVYIKKDEDAAAIKEKAKELGISLSIHGQYFINLNSPEKEKIEASKKRILNACEVGEKLGAKKVVFHPGYYGKSPRDKAYKNIRDNLKDLMKELKKRKYKIQLAPETMGKVNVFGSVEEISQLVKDTGCSYCIDYAHILARDKKVDYKKIEKLFPEDDWHVHFSGIVYGEKGERHHKTTLASEWKTLLKNLPKNKNITIINESPTHLEDAIEGLEIYGKI